MRCVMERQRRGTRERSGKSGLSAAFLQALDDYRMRMLIACFSAMLMTVGILQLAGDFIDKRIGFRSGSSSADFFRLDVQRTPQVAREANHRQKGTHPMVERASSFEAIPPLERHRNEDGDGDGEPGDRRQRERPLNRLDTHNMLTIADDHLGSSAASGDIISTSTILMKLVRRASRAVWCCGSP